MITLRRFHLLVNKFAYTIYFVLLNTKIYRIVYHYSISKCQIENTLCNMDIRYYSVSSSNPKCPEDGEELSREKVSALNI